MLLPANRYIIETTRSSEIAGGAIVIDSITTFLFPFCKIDLIASFERSRRGAQVLYRPTDVNSAWKLRGAKETQWIINTTDTEHLDAIHETVKAVKDLYTRKGAYPAFRVFMDGLKDLFEPYAHIEIPVNNSTSFIGPISPNCVMPSPQHALSKNGGALPTHALFVIER